MLGQPVRAVGSHQGGVIAESGEPFAGQLDQLGFEVYGEHVFAAEPMREQRRVVSAACADLQYPVPVLDVEGFEHAGHQAGHAGGGEPTG